MAAKAADTTEIERSARIRRVVDEVISRRCSGEPVSDDSVEFSHPELMPELGAELRALRLIDGARFVAEATQVVATPNDDSRGAPIGRLPLDAFPGYELLRELHRGGQGIVYLAIQKATRRKVAIKVMLEGPFAGQRDRLRFEREVQILGSLNHPNIVAVHDSGTTATGSFYYVMDYISGVPLDEHVREKFPTCDLRIPIRRRGSSASGPRIGNRKPWTRSGRVQGRSEIDHLLVLFSRICEAVNAAHLRGVIHRDLKPGNIRIDANGEPHVLDFGLAKIAMGDVTPDSRPAMMTTTGQFVGSLPWASPEQAEGRIEQIDVRTDVYSLGVILYQMLTDRFPYSVVGNMRDVLDNILRAEPARPSTIHRSINDEVETIVLKCLAKERERRYQTAGEIARDIGHYRAGEPIEAKRDSTWYVVRKTMRRHKAQVAVAALVMLLIAGSSVWLSVMYSTQGRLLLQVQQMHGFLDKMLKSLKPREARSPEIAVRRMLETAEGQLAELGNQPDVEASMRHTVGMLYRDIGDYGDAVRHLRRCLDIRRTLLPDPDPNLAGTLLDLAAAHWFNGEFSLAEPIYDESLTMQNALHAGDHPDVARAMTHVAANELRLGDWGAALDWNTKSLEMRRALANNENSIEVAQGENNLAKVYLDVELYDQAEELFRGVYATIQELKPNDPEIPRALNNIAMCLIGQGDYDQAANVFEEALGYTEVLVEDHPFVAESRHGQALLHFVRGDLVQAEERCRLALALRTKKLRTGHPEIADSQALLGQILLKTGRTVEAKSALETAFDIRREAVPDHWRTGEAASLLGECLTKLGRFAEAEPRLSQGHQLLRDRRGPDASDTQDALARRIELYTKWGKPEKLAECTAQLTAPKSH